MAQAIILKTDLAATSNANAGQKPAKNIDEDAGKDKVQSFSSALDNQVEKQEPKETVKSDKTETTDDKAHQSEGHKKTKAETEESKDGKVLPDDSSVSDNEGLFPIADTSVTLQEPFSSVVDKTEIIDAKTDELNVEGAIATIVPVDTPVAPIVTTAIQATKKELTNVAQARATTNAQTITNVNTSEQDSIELSSQENVTTDKKQQGVNLRSDILNAILKKTDAKSEKVASALSPQKLSNSSELSQMVSEDGVSEEQKMLALANLVKQGVGKSKSQTFGAALERNSPASLTSISQPVINASTSAVSAAVDKAQPSLDIQPAIQSAAWNRVLSSRVIWMAREGVQQASLKMNPANLGPVEVKLHMHNDQASVSFIAHNATTRDALEQALPRLRESFQENQMELAHADVSQQDFSQAEEQENNNTTNSGSITGGTDTDSDIESNVEGAGTSEQELAMGLSVFA